MTEVAEQVRETFGAVSREVAVPPFDEVAFRREVRRARRRRTGRAAMVAGVAAGVVTAALVAVPPLLEGSSGGRPEVAAPSTDAAPPLTPGALPQPLYFTAGGQLMVATPDGVVHDLAMRSEGVVGATAEGAFVLDDDSHVVWVAATSSGEEDRSYTFAVAPAGSGSPVRNPVTTPVQSAALSGDGRWLAWLDLDDTVTVWDLKADELTSSFAVGRNAFVASVSDQGALVSVNGNLIWFGTSFDLDVPTQGDGYGAVADAASGLVSVADRDDVTRIYDVTEAREDPVAPLVDTVPGTGRLAPYAEAMVSVDGNEVRVWADGDGELLTGVEGAPQTAGWIDEDHAVVTSAEAGGTAIYVCPVADAGCTRVAFSEADVRLAD